MIPRKTESLRHHPDDRVERGPEPECAANDTGIRRESVAPLFVGDHDDRCRASSFVAVQERAPERGRNACGTEPRGRHLGNAYERGAAVRGYQVTVDIPKGRDITHRPQLETPGGVVEEPGPGWIARI